MQSHSIQQHLSQALASPLFRNADRQAGFLRFVVERALQAPGSGVKEFEIGIAVYQRRDDYDPRADPIVRVEAARLRARLREYYDSQPDSPIRIELPKGSYVPQFVTVTPRTAQQSQSAAAPTLALVPFRSLGQHADDQLFCEGLTEELLHQLAQQPALQVIARGTLERIGATGTAASHLAEGSVRRAGNHVRIALHVMELGSGHIALSKSYQHELTDVFAVQEAVSRSAAADIAAALQHAATHRTEQH